MEDGEIKFKYIWRMTANGYEVLFYENEIF